MAVVVRRDRLRTAWGQVDAAVLIAFTAYVVVAIDVPWWADLLGVVFVGWLASGVAQAHGSVLLGRVIGSLAALALWAAVAGWLWLTGLLVALIALLGLVRVRGSRNVDAAGIDRTTVPLLDDEGDRLVDAIDAIWKSTRAWGDRSGLRAVHSHGSVAVGAWVSSRHDADGPGGVAMFDAGRGGSALVRFSNFPGEVARDDRRRRPHGMAVHLDGDHGSIDLVLVDILRFPAATREDFVSFTYAFASRGAARAWSFVKLVATGRSTLLSIVGLFQPPRTSYLDRRYHGLNTFRWRLAAGADPVPVRYVARPVRTGRRGRARRGAPDGLEIELRERLAEGRASFDVFLELGTSRRGRPLPDTITEDPLHRYPRRRPRQPLCRIELTRFVETEELAGWGFDPFNLPDGVRPSDDEILHARRAAYAVSQVRRSLAEARR